MSLKKIKNMNGPELVYSYKSGIKIIEKDGFYFKNHSKTGLLQPYEDWRLSADDRARDLASKLNINEIAGLMLFTSHLAIPSTGVRAQLYDGKSYEDSQANAWDLTDIQKKYFCENYIKHSLVTSVESPEVAARWNNNIQEISESQSWGIPVIHSSDPRHSVNADTEFNEGSGGKISQWPEQLGLAATFDPNEVKKFGKIASLEYRAMGLTLTLTPQADLGTEPRWMRLIGTFGEHIQLCTDMVKAYVDGFQTTYGSKGWGKDSVNTMVKHWPGGGACEAGRDAHFGYGKYAVFPGENFKEHQKAFVNGAFKLDDGTLKASSVMPYYSISYNQDKLYNENVGSSYNKYMITDLLRNEYNYDEVICTDWCITGDEPTNILELLSGDQCWGVEEGYTVAERHYKLLLAGIDQFGGNKDPRPILEAYELMKKDYGEDWAEARFRKSAMRILRNMFRIGLFENPYTDIETAKKVVGNNEYMEAGLETQKKSIVMLKNKNNVLPLSKKTKVYIPKRLHPEQIGWYLEKIPSFVGYNIDIKKIGEVFEIVERPDQADVAIVRIKSPEKAFDRYNGYDIEEVKKGENGYVPISLQYRPYTAKYARQESIAGDPRNINDLNRTYKDKSVDTLNESDLDLVLDTKKQMGDKPVIVIVSTSNPFVISEFEPVVDSILIEFGVTTKALIDILSGDFEPSGLLPIQMPINMKTVELQQEDVAFDMEPYTDSCGNVYDFGFGLNFSGVISDERNKKYTK